MIERNLSFFIISLLCLNFSAVNAYAQETLSWEDCVKEAAKNHPDLIAAGQEIKQSQATKRITASALYPQLDSNLDASTQRAASNNAVATISDSYNYGLSATQLIFDGKKTINETKAAAENINASKQNFKYISATVRYRLRSAFIDLFKAQEMLRITQEIYEIRRSNLELIALRYESGLEHKGALLTAQADTADANYGIIQAQRNMEVARMKLTKEMGRPQLLPMAVKGDFEIKDDIKGRPDFAALSANNPSLKQIIAQKNAAEFSLRSTYGDFLPTLSGSAGANKNGTLWEPRGNQWNLGLSLSLPIFEGGLRFAQVDQAKAYLNQLKENERSTRDGIILSLEQTWSALLDAIQNVEVQKDYLIANQERSKIAQAQYSIGFITFDNWTIIEDNLVKAKKAYLDAQAGMLLAQASWIQAKGETLEYE